LTKQALSRYGDAGEGRVMKQFHNEREQKFIDLAATLADEFAPRAAKYD